MDDPPYIPINAPAPKPIPTRVQVTDINMPFASMVGFMVKWAIASIPALIILFFIVGIGAAVFGGVMAALFHR